MICEHCAECADNNIFGEEEHVKAGCKGGTHCDCHHKPAPSERWINKTGKPVFPVG